ncbi:hypothetical protein ABVK25_003504 [Lepraria finkii]|uniref:Uncharacterized protein n=1 Tax=Lepraria finkii TaxID=1340010 RepID=A0ABR4BF47_9LECA
MCMPDAAKPLMYKRNISIQGTYLKNVHEDAALFYVCENKMGAKPKKSSQCAVVYQAYSKGFMAYVGFDGVLYAFSHQDALLMVTKEHIEKQCAHEKWPREMEPYRYTYEEPLSHQRLSDCLPPEGSKRLSGYP